MQPVDDILFLLVVLSFLDFKSKINQKGLQLEPSMF
ncbi:hypothetical protein CLV24_12378 [Pontibacter ummariensis]|uniref:Uncharacterized protein n=1 Tax=Pontibacter ummariensis TaxID=1610492 RepID=A0A239JTK7_9BACT|nr:hypothetical protein CLV24_12378 [Pontibacter ummariensis]SNT09217.1 hypothetical protein SAMN06296052_12378 [Pontibacter ummariensis]